MAKELGVRSCLCYEVSDRDGMEKAKEAVMENAAFIKYALQDDSRYAGRNDGNACAVYHLGRDYGTGESPISSKETGYHIHVARRNRRPS